MAAFVPEESSLSINGDISTTTRPAAVRFEIGGRGGRSKESRGVRSRRDGNTAQEGRERSRGALMRGHEKNGHNRSLVRDVRCHLATHASSFMPLDSGDRT